LKYQIGLARHDVAYNSWPSPRLSFKVFATKGESHPLVSS
jgi:hypothetical protein